MHRRCCYFQEMVAIGSRGWIDKTRCYRRRDWAGWTCPFSLHATSNLCLVIGNQSSVVQVHLEGLRWLADGDRCFRAILNIVKLRSVCEFDTTCPWVKSNAGLDTNGCPLGNSKFTLLSDYLNICLWLSACQVENIYQNHTQTDTNFTTQRVI